MIRQRNALSLLLALMVASCGSVRPTPSSSAKDISVFDTSTMKETRLIERDNVVTFGGKRKSALDFYRVLIADQPGAFKVESLDVLDKSTLATWQEYQGSSPSDEFQRQMDLLEHVLNLRADLSTSDKVARCRGGKWVDTQSEQRYGMSCQSILRVFGPQPTDTTEPTDPQPESFQLPSRFSGVYHSNLTSYQKPKFVDTMLPIVGKDLACYVDYRKPDMRLACGKNIQFIHRARFTCQANGVCSVVPGTNSSFFPDTIIFAKNQLRGIVPGKAMFRPNTFYGHLIEFAAEGLHQYVIPREGAEVEKSDNERIKKACGNYGEFFSHRLVKRVVEFGKTVYTYQCSAQGIDDWEIFKDIYSL